MKRDKGQIFKLSIFSTNSVFGGEIQVPQMKTVNKTHLYHPIDLAILDRLGYMIILLYSNRQ